MISLLEKAILTALVTLMFLYVPPAVQRMVAPEPVAKPSIAEVSPAPIWSRRCEERGLTMVAHQADGGPWRVSCTVPVAKQ